MNEERDFSRSMWVIACDDIRREVGGKLSYMGIYTGDIIVPTFPFVLRQLAVIMNVRTSATDPLETLAFRIMKDDEILAKAELTTDQLSDAKARFKDEDLGDKYFQFSSVVVLGQLELQTPCTLKFRADTERGEVKGGRINVTGWRPSHD